MLTREQIDQYEKKIDETYTREKEAIKIMRRLLAQSEGHANGTNAVSILPEGSYLSLTSENADLPPLEPNLETPTLAKKIEAVVQAFPKEKWTMRRMLQYLRNVNFPLGEKPEGSISASLGKLAKSGRLSVVRQGAGSVASIYQWNPGWHPDLPVDPMADKEPREGESIESGK